MNELYDKGKGVIFLDLLGPSGIENFLQKSGSSIFFQSLSRNILPSLRKKLRNYLHKKSEKSLTGSWQERWTDE